MDNAEAGKRIAEGFGLITLTNIISVILGFSTSALIARYLDVAAFGEFSLALAIFATVLTICGFGLNFAVVRYVSKFEGENKETEAHGVIKSAMVLSIVSGLFFSAMIFVFAGYLAALFQKGIGGYLRVFAVGVVFAGMMAILLAVFQGLQKFGSLSKLTIFHNSAKFIFVVALLLLGAGTIGATIGIVGAYIATCMLGVYLVHKYVRLQRKTSIFPYSKLLSYGLSLTAYTWLLFFINRISMYLLGIYSVSRELGLYGTALVLTQGFFIIPDSLNSALFPILSKIHGRNSSSMPVLMGYSWKFGAVITFPILVYIGVFTPAIVSLLFPSDYLSSASVLRIMLLVGFSYFFYSTALSALLALDKKRFLIYSAMLSGLAGIVSGLFLIPKYGAVGAALADGIAYLLLSTLAVLELRSASVRIPSQILLKIGLSTVPFGAFLWYSLPATNTLLGGMLVSFLGFALYSAILLLSKTLGVSEMRILYRVITKK